MDIFGKIGPDEQNGSKVLCLENLMILSQNVHTLFDNLEVRFESSVCLLDISRLLY